MFGVYFYLCGFSKYIHSSKKILLKKVINFSDNLYSKVHFGTIIIEAINHKKRFGYTYSSLGLMTLMTFFKYIFIYGNIMMKIYKFKH